MKAWIKKCDYCGRRGYKLPHRNLIEYPNNSNKFKCDDCLWSRTKEELEKTEEAYKRLRETEGGHVRVINNPHGNGYRVSLMFYKVGNKLTEGTWDYASTKEEAIEVAKNIAADYKVPIKFKSEDFNLVNTVRTLIQ